MHHLVTTLLLFQWGKKHLTCYASLETSRRSFKHADEPVSVVVDETDWGYKVGEIEVMVSGKPEINLAVKLIERMAKGMGECSE